MISWGITHMRTLKQEGELQEVDSILVVLKLTQKTCLESFLEELLVDHNSSEEPFLNTFLVADKASVGQDLEREPVFVQL
jgi:hypothetical protein